MRKIKHLSFAVLAGATLLVSSCSNQMYSYRSKVKVDQQTAQVNKAESIKEIEAKKADKVTLPVAEMKAPALAAITAPAPAAIPNVVTPKMEPVLKDIQSMVPQQSSKASVASQAKAEFKSVKEKIKTLKKDVTKAQSSINIDSKKWMIVGGILWLAGFLLGGLVGGSIFWAIGVIGSVIFIVGLIVFLIDYLK
jgi:PBP1b-binding outer membrane lipoprotein LpoB